MESLGKLSREQRSAVEDLVTAAQAADGAAPLNEEALLFLGAPGARHHLVADDWSFAIIDGEVDPSVARVIGYAQWQPDNATGQLVVHPDHRRSGVGRQLLEGLRGDSDRVAVWAFHDLPGAQGFAAGNDLSRTRSLLVLGTDLVGAPVVTPPAGITLRAFTEPDTDAFLATNAAAFATHPEQGHFSADDLARRQAEDWWDPAGLILATDDEGVAGFHWTKRHPDAIGEVYVLGVHPRAAGRGLGRVLLNAGLAHLWEGGSRRVILYVDADNTTAVRLYERGGFTEVHRDSLYTEVTR
ncbi:MAG: mycothiol synthase [Propioniciclava sp.]